MDAVRHRRLQQQYADVRACVCVHVCVSIDGVAGSVLLCCLQQCTWHSCHLVLGQHTNVHAAQHMHECLQACSLHSAAVQHVHD